MSAEETLTLAASIAEKIQKIKELSKKKGCIKNRLEEVNAESTRLFEEINRMDDMIRSMKHEITEELSDVKLKLVIAGDTYDS